MPLIVLANREPLREGDGGWEPSVGGLTTALLPVLEQQGGVWVAWGETHADTAPRLRYPEDEPRLEVHRLALSEAEVTGYYYGLANRVLWPICHYFTEQMDIERSFFGVYKSVNEKFADAAANAYTPGDTLWVQDYHLMLAPAMLRLRLPDARIGFFFLSPGPAEEVWRALPWSRPLTEGLLGADLIGFHTEEYVENFLEAAARVPGAQVGKGQVTYRGRVVRVEAHLSASIPHTFRGSPGTLPCRTRPSNSVKTCTANLCFWASTGSTIPKAYPNVFWRSEQFFGALPRVSGAGDALSDFLTSRTRVESYRELKRTVDEIADGSTARTWRVTGYRSSISTAATARRSWPHSTSPPT